MVKKIFRRKMVRTNFQEKDGETCCCCDPGERASHLHSGTPWRDTDAQSPQKLKVTTWSGGFSRASPGRHSPTWWAKDWLSWPWCPFPRNKRKEHSPQPSSSPSMHTPANIQNLIHLDMSIFAKKNLPFQCSSLVPVGHQQNYPGQLLGSPFQGFVWSLLRVHQILVTRTSFVSSRLPWSPRCWPSAWQKCGQHSGKKAWNSSQRNLKVAILGKWRWRRRSAGSCS